MNDEERPCLGCLVRMERRGPLVHVGVEHRVGSGAGVLEHGVTLATTESIDRILEWLTARHELAKALVEA